MRPSIHACAVIRIHTHRHVGIDMFRQTDTHIVVSTFTLFFRNSISQFHPRVHVRVDTSLRVENKASSSPNDFCMPGSCFEVATTAGQMPLTGYLAGSIES